MPSSPVPADPGWDDDLAWLDRDPMTAAELQACAGPDLRARRAARAGGVRGRTSRSPGRRWPRSARLPPMSCWPSRRPPRVGGGRASPAPRGSFPASRPARRPRSGPGWSLDVLPGCAGLAVAADAAVGDDRFDGVSEGELVGRAVRMGPGRGPRGGPQARGGRRAGPAQPRPQDAEFTADQIAYALGESRVRGYELMGTAGHLDTHLPGTKAALLRRHAEPGQGPADRHGHRAAG